MGGTLDEADTALRRFDGETALAGYDAALAQDPDRDGRAAAGRVRALWLLRRWDEARAEFYWVADRADSVHVELARGVLALGQPDDPAWFCTDSGSAERDVDEAALAFRAAIRLDETCAEAVAGHATAIRMSGKVAKARQALANASEAVRASAPVLVEQAMCAVELDDLHEALDCARRALKAAPGDLHAQLVRLSLLRRVERGSQDNVGEAEAVLQAHANPPAVLLESYGWALADRADAESDPERKTELFRRARAQFERSIYVRPTIPGAVNGLVDIYLSHDDVDTAMKVAKEAIAREPTSPKLLRCRADVLTHSGGTPQERLDAYRQVLDRDPRDLGARLQVVSALAQLDKVQQARKLVAELAEELPGNNEVILAALSLDNIRPWKTEQDAPDKVLDRLIKKATATHRLKPEVADRLRNSLGADPEAVLEQAHEEEQKYLRARNEHLDAEEHRKKRAGLYALGSSALIAGILLAIAGVGRLVWLLASPAGLATGWMWAITIGVLVVAPALAWVLDEVLVIDAYFGVMVAGALAVLAASIWQGILLLGAGAGAAVGVGVALAIGGAIAGGFALIDKYERVDWSWAQNAFYAWLDFLYTNGVEPAANEALSKSGRVYGTNLSARSRTVSEAIADIDTSASKELRDLLQYKSGGSFALAGPRGAGKSILLERWCKGNFLRADGTQQVRHDLHVLVDAPVGYKAQEFLAHLFGQTCRAVVSYAEKNEAELKTLSSGRSTRAKALLRRLVAPSDASRPDKDDVASALKNRAVKERRMIRSVVSHTKEGELSAGFPNVAGARSRMSQRWDELPLNHPELVDRFCDFLQDVANVVGDKRLKGKVLIGIDELDRISDGEDAQRFVNELKAVFKAKRCHFLVSVSEDALADFELAAMGMRTAFDSAFSKIVRVDYLGLDQAQVVLHRRVPDITEQFVALAYVLSGGLMRELCRTADEIGKLRSTQACTLKRATTVLAQGRLSDHARAAMDRLNRSSDRRAGAVLIRVLDEHPTDELTAAVLRAYATTVQECAPKDGEPELVAAIRMDVVVMAEYLAVLLDIFDDQLDEGRMKIGYGGNLGDFETLARVRRYLGANPYGARELLLGFRKAWSREAACRASEPGAAR